ncbi:S8 family peptidase [Fulvimarina pelagi]|nr:S8 family serine peptidase [Fulvimarina pelagi]
MAASRAVESPNTSVVVENEKRAYLAIEVPNVQTTADFDEDGSLAMDAAPELERIAREYGAEIVEDYQYELESRSDAFTFEGSDEPAAASLADVTQLIHANEAWADTTGKDVTIAIVDTGIDGTQPEFPASKRAGHWEPYGDTPWTDWDGHGTMCATISAAVDAEPGSRYRGVAPDARIIACKTRFYDSELAAIYDYLAAVAAEMEGPIVASNSFGRKTGHPPTPPVQSDFLDALDDAIAAGIFIFFSAGNNHQLAGGHQSDCNPNSIWLHKSREDVFPVATCDLQKSMWFYSSRGPGQFAGQTGMSDKPDATAPTPANGKILYGGGEKVLPDGWGTSGACPQVAGLAALLLSLDPELSRDALFDAIRDNATDLGLARECQGAGMIDCKASVDYIRKVLTS